MNRKILIRLAPLVAVLVLVGACAHEKVDEAHVGVRYTDGPIEGRKWEKIVEPGGSEWVFNDHVYQLPARQVTYIADADEGADTGPLELTAKGGEAMHIELAVRFFLNTRAEAFRPFFLEICQKHDCWTDDGWVTLMNETFGNPMRAVVSDIGLEYDAEELRYDNGVRDDFAARFAERFVKGQERLIGRGDYFCGPGYKRKESKSCPPLSVEVTSVRFADPERESIREKEELAIEQEDLAVQEEKTARARQKVNEAKATPEYLELQKAEAMVACAQNPQGCQLTVIVSSDGRTVDVTAAAN